MVTLTAGGRTAPSLPRADDPAVLLDRWHRTLERMLVTAQEYGRLDALVTKRRAWLDANPFHERHDERHALMWQAALERNRIGGTVQDLAAELSRLQGRMPPGMLDGLGALMGHPLWPYIGNRWAMTAARLQTTDIFLIASQVMMDLRAESEATEYDEREVTV